MNRSAQPFSNVMSGESSNQVVNAITGKLFAVSSSLRSIEQGNPINRTTWKLTHAAERASGDDATKLIEQREVEPAALTWVCIPHEIPAVVEIIGTPLVSLDTAFSFTSEGVELHCCRMSPEELRSFCSWMQELTVGWFDGILTEDPALLISNPHVRRIALSLFWWEIGRTEPRSKKLPKSLLEDLVGSWTHALAPNYFTPTGHLYGSVAMERGWKPILLENPNKQTDPAPDGSEMFS